MTDDFTNHHIEDSTEDGDRDVHLSRLLSTPAPSPSTRARHLALALDAFDEEKTSTSGDRTSSTASDDPPRLDERRAARDNARNMQRIWRIGAVAAALIAVVAIGTATLTGNSGRAQQETTASGDSATTAASPERSGESKAASTMQEGGTPPATSSAATASASSIVDLGSFQSFEELRTRVRSGASANATSPTIQLLPWWGLFSVVPSPDNNPKSNGAVSDTARCTTDLFASSAPRFTATLSGVAVLVYENDSAWIMLDLETCTTRPL